MASYDCACALSLRASLLAALTGPERVKVMGPLPPVPVPVLVPAVLLADEAEEGEEEERSDCDVEDGGFEDTALEGLSELLTAEAGAAAGVADA